MTESELLRIELSLQGREWSPLVELALRLLTEVRRLQSAAGHHPPWEDASLPLS